MFSALQMLFNQRKMDPCVWSARLAEARLFWNYALDVAMSQIIGGRGFCLEHPATATSWSEPKVMEILAMPGVRIVTFDQCRFGLKSPSGSPIKKATKLMTNMNSIEARFSNKRCQCQVPHREIQGSEMGHRLSVWAQTYPDPMVRALADAAVEWPWSK